MYPKKPGLEETEELGADTSVDDSLQLDAPETPAANQQQPVAADVQATDPTDDSSDTPAPNDEVQADQQGDAAAEAGDLTAPESSSDAPAPDQESVTIPAKTTAPDPHGLKRGELVEGTIVSTSPTVVTVNLGERGEGVIPGHELERMNRQTLESLAVGETIKAFVVNPRDHNGNIVLSINRALEEIDWQRAEEFRQSQETYESRIAGYNKGGLIVRFGRLRGFVPQSQMSADRRRSLSGETPEERWGSMVNEPIIVKVMEVDRQRNRLILSERFASRQTREKRKEALIKDLEVGEVREGRVVSLEDFGAFVDVGGAEGLVHLTELSWQHVTHPKEVLQVGQTVRVEVISIDEDNKRIGLSMKRQAPDPWDTIAIDYTIGQLVQGMVTKLTKFGAFAQLVDVPEIEGLIHISELSDKRVNHPREVVDEGDKLTLRVVKIDIKNRRLGLSLKKVNSAEYLDLDWSTSSTDSTVESSEPAAEAPGEATAEEASEVSAIEAPVAEETAAEETVAEETTTDETATPDETERE